MRIIATVLYKAHRRQVEELSCGRKGVAHHPPHALREVCLVYIA